VSLVRGKVRLTITLLCQPFLFDSNKDATGCVLEYGERRGVSFLIDETSSTLITFSLLTVQHVTSSFSSHLTVLSTFF